MIMKLSLRQFWKQKEEETGKAHQVWLLAVKYNGKLYFSRRNTNSDWLRNAQKNPDVRIEFGGQSFVW